MTTEKPKTMSVLLRGDDPTFKKSQQTKRAKKMDKATAKRFGGRRQPASGSGIFNKGDVKLERVLIDNKYTDQKSYSLTQKDIAKLCREAEQERHRVPAFQIRFDRPIDEMGRCPKAWVVIPVDFFEELLRAAGG